MSYEDNYDQTARWTPRASAKRSSARSTVPRAAAPSGKN